MRRKFCVSSDFHFFHAQILNYCNRPFSSVGEMNEELIKRHNKIVGPNDIFYHLGDIGFGTTKEEMKNIISRLNGHTKILILGNHDRESMGYYYDLGFNAVLRSAVINLGKTTISLAHYPKRNIFQIIKLFYMYTWKMLLKKRNLIQIKSRLIREWKMYMNNFRGYHVHGHTHNTNPNIMNGKNINVCVELWNYGPATGDQILALINKQGQKNVKKS